MTDVVARHRPADCAEESVPAVSTPTTATTGPDAPKTVDCAASDTVEGDPGAESVQRGEANDSADVPECTAGSTATAATPTTTATLPRRRQARPTGRGEPPDGRRTPAERGWPALGRGHVGTVEDVLDAVGAGHHTPAAVSGWTRRTGGAVAAVLADLLGQGRLVRTGSRAAAWYSLPGTPAPPTRRRTDVALAATREVEGRWAIGAPWDPREHHGVGRGSGDDDAPAPPVPAPALVARAPRPVGARRRTSRTIPALRLHRAELRAGAELAADAETSRALLDRPRTRADCVDGPRPCVFVACRHHLYLDVDPDTGSLKLNFPDVPVEEMEHTCALDLAGRGGLTLEETGAAIGVTRERVRQLEEIAYGRLRGDRGLEAVDWMGDA